MPVVNGKHYAYTKAGKYAAKKANKESIALIVANKLREATFGGQATEPDPESGKPMRVSQNVVRARRRDARLSPQGRLAAKERRFSSG